MNIALTGSTVSTTLLKNLSVSAGKNGFPFNLSSKSSDFDFWFKIFKPKFCSNKYNLIDYSQNIDSEMRCLLSDQSQSTLKSWGGVYSLDECQTGEQEEGLNKSFLTLTLQKQIPKSIRVSSAAGACANTAGQNSHGYLFVTSFANKSSSLAFQTKSTEQGGMKENAFCLFKQQLVCHWKYAWNIHNRFLSW